MVFGDIPFVGNKYMKIMLTTREIKEHSTKYLQDWIFFGLPRSYKPLMKLIIIQIENNKKNRTK